MTLRLFKTKRFATQARKAWISDADLRQAFREILQGRVDNLGGGVWKKRLNSNRHRSIVLARGGRYWVYQCLFAKQDQSNISPDELLAFRELAKAYEGLSEAQVEALLAMNEFMELDDE